MIKVVYTANVLLAINIVEWLIMLFWLVSSITKKISPKKAAALNKWELFTCIVFGILFIIEMIIELCITTTVWLAVFYIVLAIIMTIVTLIAIRTYKNKYLM